MMRGPPSRRRAAALEEKDEKESRIVLAAPRRTMPPLSLEEENMERCRQMKHCQEQLVYWRQYLQRLHQEQRQIRWQAALEHDPAAAWTDALPKKERWKKKSVLFVLQQAPTLPAGLREAVWARAAWQLQGQQRQQQQRQALHNSRQFQQLTRHRQAALHLRTFDFDDHEEGRGDDVLAWKGSNLATATAASAVPKHLLLDRDIILTRLARDDCAETYRAHVSCDRAVSEEDHHHDSSDHHSPSAAHRRRHQEEDDSEEDHGDDDDSSRSEAGRIVEGHQLDPEDEEDALRRSSSRRVRMMLFWIPEKHRQDEAVLQAYFLRFPEVLLMRMMVFHHQQQQQELTPPSNPLSASHHKKKDHGLVWFLEQHQGRQQPAAPSLPPADAGREDPPGVPPNMRISFEFGGDNSDGDEGDDDHHHHDHNPRHHTLPLAVILTGPLLHHAQQDQDEDDSDVDDDDIDHLPRHRRPAVTSTEGDWEVFSPQRREELEQQRLEELQEQQAKLLTPVAMPDHPSRHMLMSIDPNQAWWTSMSKNSSFLTQWVAALARDAAYLHQKCSWLAEGCSMTMQQFDLALRNDASIMISLLRTWLEGTQVATKSPTADGHATPLASDLWWPIQDCGPALRNNREFCLQVAQIAQEFLPSSQAMVPKTALKRWSQKLRNDREVVLAYCQLNGLCLQYASYPLRRDESVLHTALTQTPLAVQYALRRSRSLKRLLGNRHYVLELYQRAADQQVALGRPLWSRLPVSLRQSDRAVVLAALTDTTRGRMGKYLTDAAPRNGDKDNDLKPLTAAQLVPEKWQHRRDFWTEAISMESLNWWSLNVDFCHEASWFWSMKNLQDKDIILRVLALYHPTLLDNARFWTTCIHPIVLTWPELQNSPFDNESPPELVPAGVWADKAYMLQACRLSGILYRYVSVHLAEDIDILEAALLHGTRGKKVPENGDLSDGEHADLKTEPREVLEHVPAFVQHLHPELVARVIEHTKKDELWELYECVDEDLWINRDVALTWIKQGMEFLHEEFPVEWEDDEEIFLLIAEHNYSDFWCASEVLCSNKEFMLRAVEKDGRVFRDAADPLEHDFDLALVSFANTKNLVDLFDLKDVEEFTFLTSFACHVRGRIQLHDVFMNIILCSMTSRRCVGDSCCFQLLDQGRETALVYKQKLAEYLGVPKGTELDMLRQASANLANWGF